MKIKKLKINARFPICGTEYSAGMDLYSCLDSDVCIPPRKRMVVPTGLAIEIPDGYFGMVVPRSGMALENGVTVLNAPGIIDSDYRGEVKCIMYNASDLRFEVHHGMRIAQLVIQKSERVYVEEIRVVSPTKRGTGGFGSTGML